MSKKMRAARVYAGESRFRVEEIDVPSIGEEDVLIRVSSSGLSHGNLSIWYFTPYLKIFPTTLGNEFAGEIAQVGKGVRHLHEGDRVAVHSALTCGNCFYCRTQQDPSCESQAVVGFGCPGANGLPTYERYHNGGLAEYVKVPAYSVAAIPKGVSFDNAARLSSISIPYRAIKQTEIPIGGTLIVNAATGCTGTLAIKDASLLGVRRVVAIGRSREGLERAKRIAPDRVEIVCTEELAEGWEQNGGLKEAIWNACDGERPDALLDFVPIGTETTIQAIFSMRVGGTAVLVGGNYAPLPLIYGELMQYAYTIRGYRGVVRTDEAELLGLMAAGSLNISDIISHRFPLERINEAVEALQTRAERPMLVQIDVG